MNVDYWIALGLLALAAAAGLAILRERHPDQQPAVKGLHFDGWFTIDVDDVWNDDEEVNR